MKKNAGMLCFFFILVLFSSAMAQPPEEVPSGSEEWSELWLEGNDLPPEIAEQIANGQAKVAVGRTETGEEILEPIGSNGTEMERFVMSVGVREAIIAESQGKLTLLRLQEGSDEEIAAFCDPAGISESQAIFMKNQLDELGNQLNERAGEIDEFIETNNIADLSPEMLASLDNDISSIYHDLFAGMDQIAQESLTPEQFNRLREVESMMPSVLEEMLGELYGEEYENMNFAIYETLDLSEEQSDELAIIQEEFNEDIRRILAEDQAVTENRDANEILLPKTLEKIKNLTAAMKSKVHDRLTVEQRERLAKIPEKYAAMIAKAKNESGQEPEDDSWKHAWKPGDPIPEGMKVPEQSPRRFPIGK